MRKWCVLDLNVRGLNSEERQLDVRAKIEESQCSIICLQETKMEFFYHRIIKKFCPKHFDNFVYSPSVGASGGIIVLWNSSIFAGALVEIQRFSVVVNFTSKHNADSWTLVTVYGPCKGIERDNFISWLYNLSIPVDSHWLLLGDFNFTRSDENRNKPGGDVNDIFIFNDIIGHLGLIELPLKGRHFTWSNMQDDPLLEQLDWFFTTPSWTTKFPNTLVFPLAKSSSDHVPCVVTIDTLIPKARIFRFENYWAEHPTFLDCVKNSWAKPSHKSNSAAVLAHKFKTLRYDLKRWHTSLSTIKGLIENCNKVILLQDNVEEQRALHRSEFNFRKNVKLHLEKRLKAQCTYWRNRCSMRWIKVGEDISKFFHAMASQRYRRNSISSIKADNGDLISDHHQMAGIIHSKFRERMGQSKGISMGFDLNRLLQPIPGLDELTKPFEKAEMDSVIKHMPSDKLLGQMALMVSF
jgi:exonuclease III